MNIRIRILAVLVFALSACIPLSGETRKDVLVLVRSDSSGYLYFIEKEVFPMLEYLEKNGLSYDVATPDGKALVSVSDKTVPALKMDAATMTGYRALVIPCMGAVDFTVPPEMVKIVSDAYTAKKIIAAQHAPEVFKAAKITPSRMATDPGIVIADTVITSYNCPMTASGGKKPIDTEALIGALAKMLR